MMRKFGKILAILGLWFLAGFTVICILGAFIGPANARYMFNSIPAALIWLILAAGLAASCVYFVIARQKSWLAMLIAHVGVMLVLVGGFVGSDRVLVRRGMLDKHEYMKLAPGRPGEFHGMNISMKDSWIEYLPQETLEAWKLYLQTSQGNKAVRELVDVGSNAAVVQESFTLGETGIKCDKLVRVCEGMRDKPSIIVPTQQGLIAMDAVVGSDVLIAGKTGKVVKTYERFAVESKGKKVTFLDSKSGPLNPAIEIDIDGKPIILLSPGETIKRKYRMPDNNMYMYLPTARDLKGRAAPLTVMMDLHRGKARSMGISAAIDMQNEIMLSLQAFYPDEKQWQAAGSPTLVFVHEQPVKNTGVILEVTDGDGNSETGNVSPNNPLHFGGYHFYLQSLNRAGNLATVYARCDDGWLVVLIGFAMTAVGVCWACWGNLRPSKEGKE